MWGGEISNENIYGLQEEEKTNLYMTNMGPNGNYLQHFITNDTSNSIPNAVLSAQVGDNALFPSVIMQHSNFNIVQPQCEELNNIQAVKRKYEEDYSSLYPGTKRRITDEHMAAEMNSLYITSDHNYCNNPAMFNPDDNVDMQFSTISNDKEDNDFELDNNSDQGKRIRDYDILPQKPMAGVADIMPSSGHSVFHFTAPLEEIMKKRDDILPPKIMEEICKPCLAMIPWSPPLHSKSQMKDDHKEKDVGKTVSTKDEMEDEEVEISYPG